MGDAMQEQFGITRGAQPQSPPPLHQLTTVQRKIVEAVDQYARTTGEPCPGRYLARRLNLNHSTVQEHLLRLHRKGWLRSPGAPARLSMVLE